MFALHRDSTQASAVKVVNSIMWYVVSFIAPNWGKRIMNLQVYSLVSTIAFATITDSTTLLSFTLSVLLDYARKTMVSL